MNTLPRPTPNAEDHDGRRPDLCDQLIAAAECQASGNTKMHAVYAVVVLGISETDVAEIFGKSRASIYAWVKQRNETALHPASTLVVSFPRRLLSLYEFLGELCQCIAMMRLKNEMLMRHARQATGPPVGLTQSGVGRLRDPRPPDLRLYQATRPRPARETCAERDASRWQQSWRLSCSA